MKSVPSAPMVPTGLLVGLLVGLACSRGPLQSPADGSSDDVRDDGAPAMEVPRADAAATDLPGDLPEDGPPPVTPRPLGATCAAASECESGFCAGGVCCNAPCEGPCVSCAASGICTPLSVGAACGGAGCLDEETYVVSRICNGLGTCVPEATMSCDPFACDPESKRCRATCTSNDHCVSGRRCSEGTCVLPGRPRCASHAECQSGFCTDGVCCNVACAGPCVSCDLPGHQGTCWPVGRGVADPHGICRAEAATTCGTTGACDGLGGCDQYPRGTVCAPPRCEGDALVSTGVCDGAGTCAPGMSVSCVPYRCVTDRCRTGCTSDAECAAPCSSCVEGTCKPVSNPDPSWGCPPAARPSP